MSSQEMNACGGVGLLAVEQCHKHGYYLTMI